MAGKMEPIVPAPLVQDGGPILKDKWVFWYLIPSKGGQNIHWSEYLHPLHSFETVENFNRLLNSIERPQNLLKGCRYYVFRNGIKPLWEDPKVKDSKAVSIEIPKSQEYQQTIHEKWTDIVSTMLEEGLGNEVSGSEYASRADTWKISCWVKNNQSAIDNVVSHLNNLYPALSTSIHVSDIGE